MELCDQLRVESDVEAQLKAVCAKLIALRDESCIQVEHFSDQQRTVIEKVASQRTFLIVPRIRNDWLCTLFVYSLVC